jgi:hypothetical protein
MTMPCPRCSSIIRNLVLDSLVFAEIRTTPRLSVMSAGILSPRQISQSLSSRHSLLFALNVSCLIILDYVPDMPSGRKFPLSIYLPAVLQHRNTHHLGHVLLRFSYRMRPIRSLRFCRRMNLIQNRALFYRTPATCCGWHPACSICYTPSPALSYPPAQLAKGQPPKGLVTGGRPVTSASCGLSLQCLRHCVNPFCLGELSTELLCAMLNLHCVKEEIGDSLWLTYDCVFGSVFHKRFYGTPLSSTCFPSESSTSLLGECLIEVLHCIV